ncbi:MAG: LamG-like jellyroll fold domain-containing protein [Phycisphaerales bacterium JB041]
MQGVIRTCAAVLAAWGASGVVHTAAAQPLMGGNYLEMDGTDDSVLVEGDFVYAQLTVEAWVRPTSFHPSFTAGVVTYGSRARSSFDFGIGRAADPRMRFFINYNQGQQTIGGTQPLALNEWQHLAVTYDGTTARLYLNGELDAERVLGNAILPSGPDALLAIGDDYPGSSEFIGGSFDEVRVWSVVRTESEIRDSRFTPLVGDEPGLAAYYTFDECGAQVVLDRTAGARHGSLGASFSRGSDDPARAAYAPSRERCLTLSSSDADEVRPIFGLIDEQLAHINAGPPALGWQPIVNRHADLHVRDSFTCDTDLDLPYVDTETFLAGADEVTLDNCGSAFYRVSFRMPQALENTAVYGVVNADDLGVVYVNGVPVSPHLTAADVADLGTDRVEDGKRLVGWPTADPVHEVSMPDLVAPGENELVVAVCSDAGEFEPAGVEFEFAVRYDCLADWNANGDVNTLDFTDFLNSWTAREPEADLNRDGRVNTRDITVWLNLWNFGCPE